jgi:cyanophycinase
VGFDPSNYLALVGSGEYLPPIEALDQALIERLKEPARVVCLPTAAGTEGSERVRYWMDLGVEHFTRLGAQVEALPVIDRASANDPDFAKTIAGANFVYLSGGKPDYLYRTLNGSRAWDAILEVMGRGGLLAGCSAGAMILGEKIYAFPGLKDGFNFLPGALIMPHFDEVPDSMIKSMRFLISRSLTLLGIDGSTALVQYEGRYVVLGKGGVTVWNSAGKKRYTQGDQVPAWVGE